MKKLLSSLLIAGCFSTLVGNVGFAKLVPNGSDACVVAENLIAKNAKTKEYSESEVDAYFRKLAENSKNKGNSDNLSLEKTHILNPKIVKIFVRFFTVLLQCLV